MLFILFLKIPYMLNTSLSTDEVPYFNVEFVVFCNLASVLQAELVPGSVLLYNSGISLSSMEIADSLFFFHSLHLFNLTRRCHYRRLFNR